MTDLTDYEQARLALRRLMELYRQPDGSVHIPKDIAGLILEQLRK